MSETVAGLVGTIRSARSRVHPHHPELARCSECRRAETSSTMYVFVARLTGKPPTENLANSPERSPAKRLLMTSKFLP
eukprot:6213512-Pleurochrysis_carterae.AAC.1